MQALQGSMAAMDDGEGVVIIPWWMKIGITPLGAYAPKTALSLESSYVNLANANLPVTLGVAPAWDIVNGWKFNASTQYLKTGIVPTGTHSILVRYSNANISDFPFFGKVDSGDGYKRRFGLFPRFSGGTNRLYYAGNNFLLVAPGKDAGVAAICGTSLYFDGVLVGSASQAWTGSDNFDIYFGRMNQYANQCGGYIQCALEYDVVLDAAQVALATTAMQTL